MSATVAIVGRPNVGKSTLFNRLTGIRQAIVDDTSGVTRDRHYGVSDWGGITFNLIDTGGFVPDSDDIFEKAIREQVQIAMEESQVILFMVDVTAGITPLDEDMAAILRRSHKKVIVVVNKVDNHKREMESAEFFGLGFEDQFNISSVSGSGTGDLLDAVLEKLPPDSAEEEDIDLPKITIVGQPNVGKSSLLNALIGKERNIVTDIAGTTRDTIHTRYNQFGKDLLLIDTAGLRKKSKVHENLEFYSVMRAVRAIDLADVCLILIDARAGIESQDLNIFSLAARKGKGVVILVNKWDLIEKEINIDKVYTENIREKLAPFRDVPILFVSATEKIRIAKALDTALEVYENLGRRISTSKLNDFLLEEMAKIPPPSYRGKFVKIKYITQLPGNKPAFAFFCNYPKAVKESYKNFLENKLREKFNFTGVPISIYFRKK